jgi:hypothetical protein
MWKGYFGWTQGPRQYIKQGYEFNLPKNPVIPIPNPWWDISNPLSDTNFTLSSWTNLGYTFYYVDSLNSGDVLDGYYCEWNDFEQKERVISENYHKFTFNQSNFAILGINPPTNQFGYYYQPHYPLKIREFSDYIEFANGSEAVIVPNYSYFSTTLNQFIWRDIYTYGFVDGTTGLGVNYPFLNEAHYPFGNNVFRIIPEGTNYLEQTIIAEPTTDNCE